LGGIARAIPATGLDFELLAAGNGVKISGAGSLFRLAGLPADDFPPLPEMEGAQSLDLPPADLSTALRQVDYAQSTDEHRQVLNGIYFQLGEGRLALVATDGRRLAWSSLPGSGEGAFILPARTAAELLRLLAGSAGVNLSFTGRQVAFDISYPEAAGSSPRRIYLVGKVVEGNYPNYRQVIPATTTHRIQLAREVFLGALQRAALVNDGANPSVHLKFSENLLELSASSAEFGEAYERLAIPFPQRTEVEIAFNPRYLIEPLRALDSAEVTFEFRDHLSPGVFRLEDRFLCVVMPLRSGVA
jgi:DNA polymerase-3 subunit beta